MMPLHEEYQQNRAPKHIRGRDTPIRIVDQLYAPGSPLWRRPVASTTYACHVVETSREVGSPFCSYLAKDGPRITSRQNRRWHYAAISTNARNGTTGATRILDRAVRRGGAHCMARKPARGVAHRQCRGYCNRCAHHMGSVDRGSWWRGV